ncbi:MAG: transketolase family protein, partial [Bacteroidetes bacterium]|nr:transketolase family protein [Bacteroidota bacterium]
PFTAEDQKFEIGKAQVLAEGTDVSIIACGHLVWIAVEAAKILAERGISVELINMHTIKPLDEAAIIKSLKKTGCVVTAEEHQQNGGLGDSVANVASRECPVPHEYVAVKDTFGESGKPTDLLQKYGLTKENIVAAAEKAMARKKA